jgi:hypothetical protein
MSDYRLSEEVYKLVETATNILSEYSDETPCSICGEITGDVLPCIYCDASLCADCGVGTRWCKHHDEGIGA